MKYDKSVYRSLVLITQFGINMLVPIFLCTIAGVFIGRKFSVEWIVIPLFVIGALAGFRNVYIMAQKIYSKESPSRGLGTRRVLPGDGDARSGASPDRGVSKHTERDNNYVKKD